MGGLRAPLLFPSGRGSRPWEQRRKLTGGNAVTRAGHISKRQFRALYPQGVNSKHRNIDQRFRGLRHTLERKH